MKIAKLQTIPKRPLSDCPYGLFLYYVPNRKKPHLGFKTAYKDPEGHVIAYNVKFGRTFEMGSNAEERDAYPVYPLLFNEAKLSGINQDLKHFMPSRKGTDPTIPPDPDDYSDEEEP